ncbi:hypothetical protein CH293_04335 [Rhodococcus sp. 14-2470-1b]|nr:hypothetical protein CH301_03750 [Rhodococcus sp. 15-1189-1-1a]OZF20298.1 hypothetical protein CH299_04295 [Rhodococcus sp. 14-2686-1-2]OZF56415.1 hypothetical protein CH293_04335 [Rhodococcus sp. 14-2470-1b]
MFRGSGAFRLSERTCGSPVLVPWVFLVGVRFRGTRFGAAGTDSAEVSQPPLTVLKFPWSVTIW